MRTLPHIEPGWRFALPPRTEMVLPNGLTVTAVARRSVPLVELRLSVPASTTDLAADALLAQTLFTGVPGMSAAEIAVETQAIGGALSAKADPDRWLVTGSALASGLDRLLELLAQALRHAVHPDREVAVERERLAGRVQVALSQPGSIAKAELLKRVYGDHPYGVEIPCAASVRAVVPERVRELHRTRMSPRGAGLVLVGDIDPDAAVELAARRLGDWAGEGTAASTPPAPPVRPGPLLLVDRPGAVQSTIRIALPSPGREHLDNAPLQLANLVFGGYFCSRWTENIREDKGYSYTPTSMIDHSRAGSILMLSADVATEVTVPALVETFYELGRIVALPPSAAEVGQARRYALGALQLSMATQAGLAGLTGALAGFGLRLDYLAAHAERLASATPEDLHRAAQAYMGPARASAVVLGDAARFAGALATVTDVEVAAR
ncbi:pitrilysin family protein [Sphaerisporangium sp. NPDC051011]|uniref:M16 family metallopeptidase n=1 Tax=Sphaerisporangium sp. NPDC051011 TaxID=3155792 RepID=UPI0033CC9887